MHRWSYCKGQSDVINYRHGVFSGPEVISHSSILAPWACLDYRPRGVMVNVWLPVRSSILQVVLLLARWCSNIPPNSQRSRSDNQTDGTTPDNNA